MNISMSLHNDASSSKQLEPCYILKPLGYYLLVIFITGTSLNGYTLYLFIRYKKLRRSSTNIFICGLVLADFCAALFEIPLPAIALIECIWIFSYVGCVLEAVIAYFAGCSNMYMLCLISLDRYFVAIRMCATSVVPVKQAYKMILCTYLLALFWTLLPIIGWSSYDYEGVKASCSVKWEKRSLNVTSYNITIFLFVYLIPVLIIIVTNIRTFHLVRERRLRGKIRLNEFHSQRRYFIECHITYTIIFIIGGYILAWTPYAIMSFIRAFIDDELFPPILGTIPAIFSKISIVWNPLIYIVRNRNIRHYLPFYTNSHCRRTTTVLDSTCKSSGTSSTVQLPLTSRNAGQN